MLQRDRKGVTGPKEGAEEEEAEAGDWGGRRPAWTRRAWADVTGGPAHSPLIISGAIQ